MIDDRQQREPADASQAAPLIGRERIRGANRVIAEGTARDAVTAEQIAAVAADTALFIQGYKLTQRSVAKAISYSDSALSTFLKGTYDGDRAQLAIDLDGWLVEEEKRRSRPQATAFVWSNVAMLIKATASYAIDNKTIALVYGSDSTGIGKTTALQAIHQMLGPRRSALLTVNKVDANPLSLLTRICEAIRCETNGGADKLFRRAVEKLKGRSHLLLIDQIHNLCGTRGDRPLFILADLFDATGTAQLWAGTADMVAYLARQRVKSSDESLVQVRRRIYPAVDLMTALAGSDGGGEPLVTLEQVRDMFSRNRLRITSDAARFICGLINTPDSGSIGSVVQFVAYATTLAEMSGATVIDVPLLRQAMRMGLGEQRAVALIRDVEESSAKLMKVG